MKIVSTFRRRLKTGRRFVFENIMDLNHVCVLHQKWFSNLRIIAQQPDYVEYRLTSSFYGLKQDLLVKGAPLDQNGYWYEFLGRLAKIRVEGSMEGPDGHLMLTEIITYSFHWALAPVFWLLRPVFKRQKHDILLADSRLLERVYELEQRGFQRRGEKRPRIVVYGGNGFFGRLVVRDLLNDVEGDILVASRRPQPAKFRDLGTRVKFAISNLNDYDSVCTLIEGAKIVVCCVGPYQGLTLNLLRACIEKKVHYVDVADDRDFMVRCRSLSSQIKAAGITAFVGCSVVPGVSSLLTRYCLDQVHTIDKIGIFITPGTRHPRGTSSFSCLLATLGETFSVLQDGNQKSIQGWTGREQVNFPPPLGNRWVYSVVDVPDYFLQPTYFGTKTISFKIGSELDAMNRCLSGVRRVKGAFGIRDLNGFVPFFRAFVRLASLFGTSQGGLMVEVSRSDEGQENMSMSVFAERRGEIIPAVLPSLAAQMILRGEITTSGIISLADWLPQERFSVELQKRQVQLAVKRPGSEAWCHLS